MLYLQFSICFQIDVDTLKIYFWSQQLQLVWFSSKLIKVIGMLWPDWPIHWRCRWSWSWSQPGEGQRRSTASGEGEWPSFSIYKSGSFIRTVFIFANGNNGSMARVAMSPAHSNYSTWSASGVTLEVGKNHLRCSVTSSRWHAILQLSISSLLHNVVLIGWTWFSLKWCSFSSDGGDCICNVCGSGWWNQGPFSPSVWLQLNNQTLNKNNLLEEQSFPAAIPVWRPRAVVISDMLSSRTNFALKDS